MMGERRVDHLTIWALLPDRKSSFTATAKDHVRFLRLAAFIKDADL